MYYIEVVKRNRKTFRDYFRRPQRYHWRIRHYGDIIATSETYHNYEDCLAVAVHLHDSIVKCKLKEIAE